MVNVKTDLHAIAARILIMVVSFYTAYLQVAAPTSLAYRAAGDGWLIDAINVAVIGMAGFALADLIWRDILRKGLILPSVPGLLRHRVCVLLYSALASAFAIRAFVATGSDTSAVLHVGAYYLLVAAGIVVEAAAIAHEKRHEESEACPSDSTCE